ncbi:oleate hydratase, partial [Staphylococcus epidermidis]|uniref:oleate hydratase n=1 Tax=Staphylococcus epidermidis TaxID=1282 RepID=UPI0037D9D283
MPLPQHQILQLPQSQSNTIPLYIPYLTPYFIPTAYKHPPLLLPNPSKNLPFIPNFPQAPPHTLFTTKYSLTTPIQPLYQ